MEKIELLSSSSPTTSEDTTKPFEHRKLKMPVVVPMLMGKVMGVGLILIPSSISTTGWFGIALLVTCFVSASISGVILARSWLVLMRWFPDKYAKEINRHPYPSIGYETFSVTGRRVVSIAMGCYSFLFATALYLVGADSIQLLFQLFNVQLPLCLWIAVFIMASAPLLWVGTPKDMMAAGIASGSSSVLIYLSLTVGFLVDIDKYPTVDPVSPTVLSVTGALGLLMTSFGGQFIIPTIQHDMENPADMQRCVVLAYTGICFIYTSLGTVSYVVYGNLYTVLGVTNIIGLVTTEGLKVAAIFFIVFHIILANMFTCNPMFQHVEDLLNVPYEVSWKRILLRSVISIAMLFVALSLPNFSIFLSVVGGALVSVLSGFLPTILYLKLSRMEPPAGRESEGPLKWYQLLALGCVFIAYAVGGVLSTVAGIYNAVENTANSTLPCFVSPA